MSVERGTAALSLVFAALLLALGLAPLAGDVDTVAVLLVAGLALGGGRDRAAAGP